MRCVPSAENCFRVLTLNNRSDCDIHVAVYDADPTHIGILRLCQPLHRIEFGQTTAIQFNRTSTTVVALSLDTKCLPAISSPSQLGALQCLLAPLAASLTATDTSGSDAPRPPKDINELYVRRSPFTVFGLCASTSWEYRLLLLPAQKKRCELMKEIADSVRLRSGDNGEDGDDEKLSPVVPQFRYCSQVAHVRVGRALCAGEVEAVSVRRKFVHGAMEKLLDMKLREDEVPTIAFAYSGGGVRAVISALGFTEAAQEMELYDCVTYSGECTGTGTCEFTVSFLITLLLGQAECLVARGFRRYGCKVPQQRCSIQMWEWKSPLQRH